MLTTPTANTHEAKSKANEANEVFIIVLTLIVPHFIFTMSRSEVTYSLLIVSLYRRDYSNFETG